MELKPLDWNTLMGNLNTQELEKPIEDMWCDDNNMLGVEDMVVA